MDIKENFEGFYYKSPNGYSALTTHDPNWYISILSPDKRVIMRLELEGRPKEAEVVHLCNDIPMILENASNLLKGESDEI